MNRTRRILSLLGLSLALGTTLPACLVTAQGRMATGSMVAYDQPPPPRAENPQGGMAGHIWISGNWSWQNNQWVWIDGHWERERAGYAWSDGRWEPRNGTWHWVSGEWVVSTSGTGTVIVGDGGRPQVQDHRYDDQPQSGDAIVTHAPNGGTIITNGGLPQGGGVVVGQGGVVVSNGQGGVIASNGAGTVVSAGGTVTITGPTAAPPPPRVENPGQPRRGYTWIEGAYQWDQDARQYDWVPGHWERTKAQKVWVPFRWELRGNVYVRVGGEWRSQ
ncbi:MAG: hypothetical protein R3B06_06595 [Kofleriaceae bacterium]